MTIAGFTADSPVTFTLDGEPYSFRDFVQRIVRAGVDRTSMTTENMGPIARFRGGAGDWVRSHDAPNHLPADGWPRISRKGIRILEAGLKHNDFSEWYSSIGNHPIDFPREEARNLRISATDTADNFLVEVWYGKDMPQIRYGRFAPSFTFDSFEFNDTRGIEHSQYIRLRNARYWRDMVFVLIEDAYLDDPHVTKYGDCSVTMPEDDDEEDEEDYEEEPERPKMKCTTLEAFL